MTGPEEDRERDHALHAAHALGLTLDPAHLDGVAANLRLLQSHAARILAIPLTPETEPAPVFRAGAERS